MSQAANQRELRNYFFLDTHVQFRFAAMVTLASALVAGFFIIAFHMFIRSAFSEVSAAQAAVLALDDTVTRDAGRFVSIVVAFSIVYCSLLFVLGLSFSHRLVGPVVAVSNKLRALARGENPRPVVMRSGDLLKPLGDTVNHTLHEVARQREEYTNAVSDALAALDAGDTTKAHELLASVPRVVKSSDEAARD